MRRELIIDESQGYIRAALIEDGKLCEIHSERKNRDEQAESIYLGRIQSIKPALKAAFVDIGLELNAFLPLEDDHKLRCGDLIIVQGLAKQSTDTKGLRITTKINLAGKWLVLIPGEKGVRISKKVKEPQLRAALHDLGEEICPPDCALIIRTASEDVTPERFKEEVRELYDAWLNLKVKAAGMTKPALLRGRQPLHMRLVREIRDLTSIVVNREALVQQLRLMQDSDRIEQQTRIIYHAENTQLIFDAYAIEPQIDKALSKRVWLPCGGYLIIDFCEALTVIDVNSGKMILGKNIEETALRVNLEAADEIARQLRLRDIGGIIVADFIDMRDSTYRGTLLDHMRKAVRLDRTQVTVHGLTSLGLMEITRKRVHHPLHMALRQSCSYCSGTGEVLTGEETAQRAMRQLRRMQLSGQRGPFVIRCGQAVAAALAVIPAPANAQVYVSVAGGKHAEKYDIDQIGADQPVLRDAVALKPEV